MLGKFFAKLEKKYNFAEYCNILFLISTKTAKRWNPKMLL